MNSKQTVTTKNQEQLLIQRMTQLPVFARITSKELQVLLKLSRTLSLDEEEGLWMEGDVSRGFYVLIRGELVAYEGGREKRTIEPLASLGEIPMLAGLAHDDEVVSQGQALLLEFPADVLLPVLKRHSNLSQRICRNVVTLLSARLQRANEQVSQISQQKKDLRERVREVEIELNDLNMIKRMRS